MGRSSTGGDPKVILANPRTGAEGALLSLKLRKEVYKSLGRGGGDWRVGLICAARVRGKEPEES